MELKKISPLFKSAEKLNFKYECWKKHESSLSQAWVRLVDPPKYSPKLAYTAEPPTTKTWFFSAAYVTKTGARILTTARYNFSKVCSFFGIDPITKIKIIISCFLGASFNYLFTCPLSVTQNQENLKPQSSLNKMASKWKIPEVTNLMSFYSLHRSYNFLDSFDINYVLPRYICFQSSL